MQAAGNDEPIPFNRVGDAGRIGLDRTQVTEGLHLPNWESRLARRSHQLVAACALRRRDAGIRLMQKCTDAEMQRCAERCRTLRSGVPLSQAN
jgi:hypothetical protein